jgi:hypothetical protein
MPEFAAGRSGCPRHKATKPCQMVTSAISPKQTIDILVIANLINETNTILDMDQRFHI